ncbi:hypothetical protein GGX14DRAFT_353383, partial [Mycena pura]
RLEDLPSWRKMFMHQWRAMETHSMALLARISHTYRPSTTDWVCSCPAFHLSRFLICKHLIQAKISIRAFGTANSCKRNRTTPFWKHSELIPLEAEVPAANGADSDGDEDCWDGEMLPPDDEDLPENDDIEWETRAATYDEIMHKRIKQLKRMTAGLEHQLQFRDQRFADTLERKGASGSFFRLVEACLNKKDRATNNRVVAPRTWESSDAMFYRPLPRVADRNT